MSKWVKLALSLAITGGCFWWTFKDVKWAAVWVSFHSARWAMLLPYLLVLAGIHVARTLRWGNLLSGMEKVPFSKLNEASAIGFMMLIVLPFRLGEFARPFLIAERSNIRRSAAMTSVVLERIVDGVTIAVLLLVLVLFLPADAPGVDVIRFGGLAMFAVFFGGFVFLVLARWQHDRVMRLLRWGFGKVSESLAEKVVRIVEGFVGALRQLPDSKNLAGFVFFTAAYWAINGYGMSLLANAFDCSGANGAACSPLHLSVYEGFVVLCVLITFLMIPAAPGSAGTFQGGVMLALALFVPSAVVNSAGAAYANVLWVVQIAQQVLTGLVFMLLARGSFAGITGKLSAKDDEEPAVQKNVTG